MLKYFGSGMGGQLQESGSAITHLTPGTDYGLDLFRSEVTGESHIIL